MTTFDPAQGRFLLTPDDQESELRGQRLNELGLGPRSVPEFDAFAEKLARAAAALVGSDALPFTMVNLVGAGQQQYFAGLFVPTFPDGTTPELDRAVPSRDLGYCLHVVDRKKALVLDSVEISPRFASNGVVDGFGIRSYMGAPLIDSTGTAIGTVCVNDIEPRPWGKEGLDLIRAYRDEMMRYIESRKEGESPATHGEP
jgi:GAF domain-containing protein